MVLWWLHKMLESGDERRMTSVICDKCGKAIPFVKKKNSLGIEENVLDRGHVRSAMNTGCIFWTTLRKNC
jgi:hypothetical protein